MGWIYKITNKENGNVYIGQTTQDIETRWKAHIHTAYSKASSSYNGYLQKAIRKYGVDSFTVEPIESCCNDELNDREIYWIDKLDTFKNGYNLTIGGGGHRKYSDAEIMEQWEKGLNVKQASKVLGMDYNMYSCRIKQLGVTQNEITARTFSAISDLKKKPVYKYTLDGKYAGEYESISLAEKLANAPSVEECVNGKAITSGGYQWRLYKADNIGPAILHSSNEKRPVVKLDESGAILCEYESVTHAARLHGVDISNLAATCRGKQKTCGGYHWKYKSDVNCLRQ